MIPPSCGAPRRSPARCVEPFREDRPPTGRRRSGPPRPGGSARPGAVRARTAASAHRAMARSPGGQRRQCPAPVLGTATATATTRIDPSTSNRIAPWGRVDAWKAPSTWRGAGDGVLASVGHEEIVSEPDRDSVGTPQSPAWSTVRSAVRRSSARSPMPSCDRDGSALVPRARTEEDSYEHTPHQFPNRSLHGRRRVALAGAVSGVIGVGALVDATPSTPAAQQVESDEHRAIVELARTNGLTGLSPRQSHHIRASSRAGPTNSRPSPSSPGRTDSPVCRRRR